MAVDCVAMRNTGAPATAVQSRTIKEVVDHARGLGLTSSGEMYSARGLCRLAGELWPELRFHAERIFAADESSDATFEQIVSSLRDGRPCLVP